VSTASTEDEVEQLKTLVLALSRGLEEAYSRIHELEKLQGESAQPIRTLIDSQTTRDEAYRSSAKYTTKGTYCLLPLKNGVDFLLKADTASSQAIWPFNKGFYWLLKRSDNYVFTSNCFIHFTGSLETHSGNVAHLELMECGCHELLECVTGW
jgi:hypothetical protein